MQILKEDIRNQIIHIAREEFLKNGFRKTSMRNIATKSNVGLGNIYNYFKNKDEIFCKVLQPLLNAFEELQEEHNSDKYLTLDVFTDKSYQQKMLSQFMNILKNYRAELKLLLFYAGGSSLENFKDTFTHNQKESGAEYMAEMHKRYPHINHIVSPFFRHTISATWLTVLGEIVSHDELTENEIERFYAEYIAFHTAGWKELMKV